MAEEYMMPGFDTCNTGNPHPLLDQVRQSGNVRGTECGDLSSAVLSSFKSDHNPQSIDVDADDVGSVPGYVGFTK